MDRLRIIGKEQGGVTKAGERILGSTRRAFVLVEETEGLVVQVPERVNLRRGRCEASRLRNRRCVSDTEYHLRIGKPQQTQRSITRITSTARFSAWLRPTALADWLASAPVSQGGGHFCGYPCNSAYNLACNLQRANNIDKIYLSCRRADMATRFSTRHRVAEETGRQFTARTSPNPLSCTSAAARTVRRTLQQRANNVDEI